MTKRNVVDRKPEWGSFLVGFEKNDVAVALKVGQVALPALESGGLKFFRRKLPLELFVSNQINTHDLQQGLAVLAEIKKNFFFRPPKGKGIEVWHEPKIRFVENEDFTSGHVEGLETLSMREVILRLQQFIPDQTAERVIERINVSEDEIEKKLSLDSEHGVGFVRIGKKGKRINVGSVETRKYRLLVALSDVGVPRTIEGVYDSIRLDKDKLNGRLNDIHTKKSEMLVIIKNTVKELQRISGLKGKIKLKVYEDKAVYLEIPT